MNRLHLLSPMHLGYPPDFHITPMFFSLPPIPSPPVSFSLFHPFLLFPPCPSLPPLLFPLHSPSSSPSSPLLPPPPPPLCTCPPIDSITPDSSPSQSVLRHDSKRFERKLRFLSELAPRTYSIAYSKLEALHKVCTCVRACVRACVRGCVHMCGVRVWCVFSKVYIFDNFIRSVISRQQVPPLPTSPPGVQSVFSASDRQRDGGPSLSGHCLCHRHWQRASPELRKVGALCSSAVSARSAHTSQLGTIFSTFQ